jgi:hypothetical protein
MSNPNRITQGEAIAGALISETSITGEDLVASDDVTVGDDLAVTGDTTTATLKVGSGGTVIKTIKTGTGAIDLGSINDGATGSGTVTITGAASGDAVLVNVPALTTGLAFAGAAITATDTATLYFVNSSGSPIDEGSATFRWTWIDLT